MKISMKFLSFIVLLVISSHIYSHAKSEINGLPWEVIAEKLNESKHFCRITEKDLNNENIIDSVIDPNSNYVYQKTDIIKILLKEISHRNISIDNKVKIEKYEKSSWIKFMGYSLEFQESELLIKDIEENGFYRLFTDSNEDIGDVIYFIISENWKKDVLGFCRTTKSEIESNPDEQLIKHCIVISHFDNCMEMISESPFLSGKIISSLVDAIQNKNVFNAGKMPNFVKGLNRMRYKRFPGDSIQEFVLFVPEDYTKDKKWPIYFDADHNRYGAKNAYSSRTGYIDLWWHTVDFKDIRWDYYDAISEIIEEKLNIDKDRIYIFGKNCNGIAAITMVLQRPDYWAECSSILGNSKRMLSGNSLNLPVILVRGGANDADKNLMGYLDFAAKCFEYNKCPYFQFDPNKTIEEVREAPVPQTIRISKPQRVMFTSDSYNYSKAYWASILGRNDENFPGSIDASIEGQKVIIKTNNIDAYKLDFLRAPIDSNKPIEINENGLDLGVITEKTFSHIDDKYENAVYVKNENIHGPISDVFKNPYVVVWGTNSKDKELIKESRDNARLLANDGLCYADSDLPEELVSSHNIILVGTPESNPWISKVQEKIPVKVKDGKIFANNKVYNNKDMGFMLVYPNPENPSRYVAVFSGTSKKAISNLYKAYHEVEILRPLDVGIFEVTDSDKNNWYVFEKFNTVWHWHEDFGLNLINVKRKYSPQKWGQLVTNIMREQIGADVAIYESPFMVPDSIPVGEISYRDIFNTFNNDWILKVKIDGKKLKKMLMVPLTDISKREIKLPIISGVAYGKKQKDSKDTSITMSEIKADQMYTLAIPEKLINGERLGVAFENYEILNDSLLIELLKTYFLHKENLDCDMELSNMKVAVY